MSKEAWGNRVLHLKRGALYLLCVIVALLFFPKLVYAQAETAVISGSVFDESGAVIPQASLLLTNVETGKTATIQTNVDGLYVFYAVRPGQYRLEVRKEGFKHIALSDLTVNVQDVLSRNFIMLVGPAMESITLTGEAAKLSAQRATVSTVVEPQFVSNMPLNGRSLQALVQLTPGTIPVPTDPRNPGQFSVNGQRSTSNYTTVDGVSANFSIVVGPTISSTLGGTSAATTIQGGSNGLISVDAMQEFRIQSSTYSPEFGRAPGAQVSFVSKAGTNQFHGTVFDYLRNDLFDARNYFNREPEQKPALRQNDFGGTVGGPILKNSTFFFFSYEGLRLRVPTTASGYFYTEEARAAVAAPYKPLVNALPIPDGPLRDPSCNNVSNLCVAQLNVAYSDPSSFDAYSLRLDHAIGSKVILFARYNYSPSVLAVRNFQTVNSQSADNQTATLGVTATLSPRTVNDFRFNWSRSASGWRARGEAFHGAVVPADAVLFRTGTDQFSAASEVIFPDQSLILEGTLGSNAQRQFNLIDSISLASGKHRYKFGVDYRRMKPTNLRGNFPVFTRVTSSDLSSGTVSAGAPAVAEPITVRTSNISVFAQDTFQVTSRLTLNYGLRWDISTAPTSADDQRPLYPIQGIFDSQPLGVGRAGAPIYSTDYTGFAPRLGVAYQLTPKTILRGGFGVFYDMGYPSLFGQMTSAFPYVRQSVNPGNGALYDPNIAAFAPPPFTTTLSSTSVGPVAIDPDLQLPLSLEWNGAVQREIGNRQTLTVTYLGTNGTRLMRGGVVALPGAPRTVAVGLSGGYSHFNALQVQYQRGMTSGLQALVSYSLTKSSDILSNDYSTSEIFSGSSVQSLPTPPLSRSDFDIRNNLSAALSYELPTPPLGSAGRVLLSNWVLDGILRLSSGPPLDIRMIGTSAVLSGYQVIPDLVPGQPIWLSAPGQPAGKVLNPDAFTYPANGAIGNLGRNSIQSPFGIAQTDLALQRRFPLSERLNLEFRAEFFNLFNHPMFGGPSAPNTLLGICSASGCSLKNSSFGTVVDPYGTLNVGLSGTGTGSVVGQSPLYALGGPRSTQFTLKLSF